RVLATNAIAVLKQASFLTLLKDGEAVERGSYRELSAMQGWVADRLRTAGQESSRSASPSPSSRSTEPPTIIEQESTQSKEEMEESQERVPEMAPIRTGAPVMDKPRSSSMATLRRASTASFRGPRGKLTDEELAGNTRTRQAKEFVEKGKVKWDV